jgi:hypothetical protein
MNLSKGAQDIYEKATQREREGAELAIEDAITREQTNRRTRE